MKKLLVLILLVSTIVASCYESYNKYNYTSTKKACVVESVETFSPGERHTLQTDYEWKVKTKCGESMTFKREVEVGDTIWFEYRKYEKR